MADLDVVEVRDRSLAAEPQTDMTDDVQNLRDLAQGRQHLPVVGVFIARRIVGEVELRRTRPAYLAGREIEIERRSGAKTADFLEIDEDIVRPVQDAQPLPHRLGKPPLEDRIPLQQLRGVDNARIAQRLRGRSDIPGPIGRPGTDP